MNAEQACRLADVAVRQLQRGLDIATLGGSKHAVQTERLALPQPLACGSDDRVATDLITARDDLKTAIREINDLVEKQVLVRGSQSKGRSVWYDLNWEELSG